MKKILLTAILILLTTACANQHKENVVLKTSHKQIEYNQNHNKNKFETEIENSLEKYIQNSASNSEMMSCGYDAINNWLSQIDKSLKQLKKILPAEKYVLIENSQKKWEEYYNLEKQSISKLIFHKGGTTYYTVAIFEKIKLIKARAEMLAFYVFLYTNN